MAEYLMPQNARVAVLVAHPDDETLWAGGTLLSRRNWKTFVGTLCRATDTDRAPRFFRSLSRLGAKGAMADLDDGRSQTPLNPAQVSATLLSLLPSDPFDLLLTHSPRGEYTRHLRHEEVSNSVLQMWASGKLQSRELWLFAYEDGGGRRFPRAEDRADVVLDLSDEIWSLKRDLLIETYGFFPDSWEVQTAPRREAFWRLVAPDDARPWLERGSVHK